MTVTKHYREIARCFVSYYDYTWAGPQIIHEISENKKNLEESILNSIVSTVSVDGLAPLIARPCTDTVMT